MVNRANVVSYANTAKDDLAGGVFAVSRNGSTIRNCMNFGDVITAGKTYGVAGIIGLVEPSRGSNPMGYKRSLNIYNCANYGNITAGSGRAGGVIGYVDATWSTGGELNIANCYNKGTISSGAAYGILGKFSAPYGKWIHGTAAEDGGYFYRSGINGGTAFNFSKTTTAQVVHKEDGNATVQYFADTLNGDAPMPGGLGSLSLSQVFAAPENVSPNSYFDTNNVCEILNTASKYLEEAKAWKLDENGDPVIDLASERAGVVEISNKDELVEYRDMYSYANRLGSEMNLNAKLTADIDLNPGYTFGYDATNKAGTVTKDGVTYYLGYGANGLIAGTFYKDVEGTLTAVETAPALYSWTMFQSKGHPTKASLRLDGAGHTVSGIYVNQNGNVGFAGGTESYDIYFSNLTLDGLVLTKNGAKAGGFIAVAKNDCAVTDCVNKVTVLSEGANTDTWVGGIVGNLGRLSTDNTVFERMPDRISTVIGSTNKATVAANTNATNDCIGGIVGYMSNGEVAYNTNAGNVYASGKADVAGIVGYGKIGVHIQTNNTTTNAIRINAYGSDTTNWTGALDANTGKYVAKNIARPYQTIVRIYGNSTSGTVSSTGGNAKAIITYEPCWISHGAWGLWSAQYSTKPLAVLPSEFVIQYNIALKTGTVDNIQRSTDPSEYKGYYWTNGADLQATDEYKALQVANTFVASATDYTAALTAVLPVAPLRDKGYVMWLDYNYSNNGIPHAVKADAKAANGIKVNASGKLSTIEISNAEALMLLNDTVNYVTKAPAVVAGVKVNSIYDVYNIPNTDAATDKTNVEAYLLAVTGKAAADRYTSLNGVTVKLTADIDLGGAEWTPLGDDVPYFNVVTNGSGRQAEMSYMDPVYGFQAKFEGQGHTISNFTFPRESGVAFFGSVNGGSGFTARVNNVKFADVNIESDGKFVAIAVCHTYNANLYDIVVEESCSVFAKEGYVAAVICQQQGEMARCKNYADVSSEGAFVGGIAVKNFWHTIYDNENHGDVTTTTTGSNVGGVSAYAYNNWNNFDRNKNYGDINAPNASKVGGVFGTYAAGAAMNHTGFENHGNVTGGTRVGGVIGYDGSNNANDAYKNFVNTGDVTGTQYVGGILGFATSPAITGATNSGTITGIDNAADNYQVQIGGIVGSLSSGSIKNSTNEGAVIGNDLYIGGIVGNSSSATIDECENLGDVTGAQFLGGIVGNISGGKASNSTNNGTITGKGNPKSYGQAQAGGIAGRAASSATIQGCENAGTVTTDSASTGKHLFSGGIVGNAAGTTNVIQNINRGTVDTKNSYRGAGIIAAIDGPSTVVQGNVNYGEIKGVNYLAGISIWVSNKSLIKGNVNYGTVKDTSVSGALIGEINNASVEVCYNVNFSDSPVKLGSLGRYADSVKSTANTTPKIYGNIDAAGLNIFTSSNYQGFVANNYSLGRTTNATLIGGKAVTEDQFKFGQVADIINNLSYTSDMFLADNENYLYKEGSDEKILPTGIAAGLTEDKLTEPTGFEENYMVQEIGVDAYPLPREAAALIYADRTIEAPQGAVTTVPAAPAAPSDTAKFYGYIDIDRNVYKPGYEITDGEKYLYPVFVDFYTAYGAGVRTTNPMGIRFQTLVKDDLSILNDDAIFNKFGTVILPATYVETMMNDEDTFGNKFDVNAIKSESVQHIDIENDGWADPSYASVEVKEGYNTYMGSVVNIKENNLTRQFSGASYVKVQYVGDGYITYITANWQTASTDSATFADGVSYDYSDETGLPRSIVEIAEKAIVAGGLSPAVQEYLDGIIEKAETLA